MEDVYIVRCALCGGEFPVYHTDFSGIKCQVCKAYLEQWQFEIRQVAGAAPSSATKRYRVNVSTSVKGIKTYDATVELSGPEATLEQVLQESDRLIAELDFRYPKQD